MISSTHRPLHTGLFCQNEWPERMSHCHGPSQSGNQCWLVHKNSDRFHVSVKLQLDQCACASYGKPYERIRSLNVNLRAMRQSRKVLRWMGFHICTRRLMPAVCVNRLKLSAKSRSLPTSGYIVHARVLGSPNFRVYHRLNTKSRSITTPKREMHSLMSVVNPLSDS